MPIYHWFSANAARELGLVDAVVLTYAARWIERHRTFRKDGERWMSVMQSAFHEQFDYLSHETVNSSVRRLERNGMIRVRRNGDIHGAMYLCVTETGWRTLGEKLKQE